jgi:hypothetical protein
VPRARSTGCLCALASLSLAQGGARLPRSHRRESQLIPPLPGMARYRRRGKPAGLDLSDTVYALNSTTIDLCLSLFPGAHFRSTKAAVKMHTLLDLRTSPRVNCTTFMPSISCCPSRGRPTSWIAATSISRACICCTKQVPSSSLALSRTFMPTASIRHQRIVRAISSATHRIGWSLHQKKITPKPLRRIRFKDADTGKTLVFLTNQFALPAATAPSTRAVGRSNFSSNGSSSIFGSSSSTAHPKNAQTWIAVSVYVLVAIVKKRLGRDPSLYTLLQILSVTLFEKMPMQKALSANQTTCNRSTDNELNLFAF